MKRLLSFAFAIILPIVVPLVSGAEQRDWLKTALQSQTPDDEVLRTDIDGDGSPDIIERWWNGKRVRWLDEAGTMQATDLRSDLRNGLLQVDLNNDGEFDGPGDMTVRWVDSNKDGIADVQSVIVSPKSWSEKGIPPGDHADWMIMVNHDRRGVLTWIEWPEFRFNCWGTSSGPNWLPNYHGNNDFVKTHAPVALMTDPAVNWENPFSFYDEDGDGLSELAIRWCAPFLNRGDRVDIPEYLDSGFISWDLDNGSTFGRETSYDMTLQGFGGKVDVSKMRHPLPGFAGNQKFDPCFRNNNWRRIKELVYMDRNASYGRFFDAKWKGVYLTFDEDADDGRWERVEMYYPTTNYKTDGPPVDLYSTARFNNKEGVTPGICGAFQSDSLGDRGEFDTDASGKGRLYVGKFDGKIHLLGAEWGAWTVDREAAYHGGAGEPSKRPAAKSVGEVVKYTDTNNNGFIDRVEYDYDGDCKIDLTVDLLKLNGPDADVSEVIDPSSMSWKDMHEFFNRISQKSWEEALALYAAAWKRDLTTPEIDKLVHSSSMRERHKNAYWIKELIFRAYKERLDKDVTEQKLTQAQRDEMLTNYLRSYYSGRLDDLVKIINA